VKQRAFEIAGQLLAGTAGDWRWNNLGDWQIATSYEQACRDLARRHAVMAGLSAHDQLLELACGYGASLDLWREQFQVSHIRALEYRQCCVDVIQQASASTNQATTGKIEVLQGRFDQPLPAALAQQSFDTVLCVDAAYHATSLAAFLDTARMVLRPNGILCFSTLMWTDEAAKKSDLQVKICQQLLQLAQIPAASVLSRTQIISLLEQSGWIDVQIQPIEQHVFAGFARWIDQQHAHLSTRQRYSMAWQKIRATARLCKWLNQKTLLHYVMIRAVKKISSTALICDALDLT